MHSGFRVVDPQLVEESLFTPDSPLTPREVDVAQAALDGAGIRDVAKRLRLTQGTVRNHLSSVMAKTGGGNRFEAVRKAQLNTNPRRGRTCGGDGFKHGRATT